MRVNFHLDPFNRLAIIHQRYRQDRQDRQDRTGGGRQRSDSIGRTVLQTVAQKSSLCSGFLTKKLSGLSKLSYFSRLKNIKMWVALKRAGWLQRVLKVTSLCFDAGS